MGEFSQRHSFTIIASQSGKFCILPIDYLTLSLTCQGCGRAIARQYGINIGVLVYCSKAPRVDCAVKPLMDQLINQVEFWVSRQVYETVHRLLMLITQFLMLSRPSAKRR